MAKSMPRLMKSALADLVRFGSLIRHKDSFVADVSHYPELAHDPKAVEALVSERFGVRHGDGSICVTDKGRREWAAVEAEAA